MEEVKEAKETNDEKPVTREEVEKEVREKVAAGCFGMFVALIKLGYNTSEAGRVVFDGVELYSREVGKMLKEAAKSESENSSKEKEKEKTK